MSQRKHELPPCFPKAPKSPHILCNSPIPNLVYQNNSTTPKNLSPSINPSPSHYFSDSLLLLSSDDFDSIDTKLSDLWRPGFSDDSRGSCSSGKIEDDMFDPLLLRNEEPKSDGKIPHLFAAAASFAFASRAAQIVDSGSDMAVMVDVREPMPSSLPVDSTMAQMPVTECLAQYSSIQRVKEGIYG